MRSTSERIVRMVPEDPSWPCTSGVELGTAEYYATFSSPGEESSKDNQISHRSSKTEDGNKD